MGIIVTEQPDQRRFEARVDGELAGQADYQVRGDVLVLTHTQVDPARRGHGVASAMMTAVFDQVRASGRRVTPLCPFVTWFIEQNPEQTDIVAG
ncbi:GNAT family N-acetyltransferase [Pilimelia columellifera]|uniref:GNAT family N-acetyltransferase n=1 Tax=Pilimelia columellifera subsp. columellifera TaxID=706583 RepID=A0ABN3NNF8_9ACTN